jgi:hypothetical protein
VQVVEDAFRSDAALDALRSAFVNDPAAFETYLREVAGQPVFTRLSPTESNDVVIVAVELALLEVPLDTEVVEGFRLWVRNYWQLIDEMD